MQTSLKLLGSTCLAALLLTAGTAMAGEKTLTRIATMPAGAEVTGLSGNAFGELFLNAQHPGGKNAFEEGVKPALIGYIAGFDSSGFTGPSLAMPAVSDSVRVAAGRYVIFAKAGDKLGSGELFGGVYDTSGALMYVSNAPDFNGFIPLSGTKAYLYTWRNSGIGPNLIDKGRCSP